MKKGLFIVCEGETDVLFYQRVIACLLRFPGAESPYEILKPINACGICNFQKWAKTKIKTQYLENEAYKDYEFTIVLCRDYDVFRRENPPVDWPRLIQDVQSFPLVEKVVSIAAYDCIEELFLKDPRGIARYLGRKPIYKFEGSNGVEKISKYFRLANKIYFKGTYGEDFINQLDVPKIMSGACESLAPLCALFSLSKNCGRCLEAAHELENRLKKK